MTPLVLLKKLPEGVAVHDGAIKECNKEKYYKKIDHSPVVVVDVVDVVFVVVVVLLVVVVDDVVVDVVLVPK